MVQANDTPEQLPPGIRGSFVFRGPKLYFAAERAKGQQFFAMECCQVDHRLEPVLRRLALRRDRVALFGSDVDITYSVNGSRLSGGDAERLQEKAEELGVSAELILK